MIGFYEILLFGDRDRNQLLEMSAVFLGTQMTHVLSWVLTKDYQNLIRCLVWVEILGFPHTYCHFLPPLVSQLGKVICPPKLDANCFLWDTDAPTPYGIACELGDPFGKHPFKLKVC